MQFSIDLAIIYDLEKGVGDACAELAENLSPITWVHLVDQESGSGWPVVRFTGDLGPLVDLIARYACLDSASDTLNIIKQLTPFLPLRMPNIGV